MFATYNMLWTAILLIVLYLVYRFLIKPTNYWKELGVPHVKGWPIFGSLLKMIAFRSTAFFDLVKEMYSKFPDERYDFVFV